MKKKMMLSLAAAAMAGTLAVGGTLAWFTDTETATNVVTTGKVDIKLHEYGGNEGTPAGEATTEKGLSYSDVMPGDVFTKHVIIENVGNDAYVRAKITVSGDEAILKTFATEGTQDDIEFGGLEKVTWIPNDSENPTEYSATVEYSAEPGYMQKDAEWTLFENITIPGEEWNNAFADSEFKIKVDVEAVQQKNVSDPWTDKTIEDLETTNKDTDDGHGEIKSGEAPKNNQ